MSYLTHDPLDPAPLLAEVRRDGDGGLALFVGVVRNEAGGRAVEELHYEAYETMAEKEMGAALERVARAHPGARVAARHRVGRLLVGDVAVVVAAAAPHRDEAFAACRAGIDEIKRTVPIWKKEFGPGGTLWVDPEKDGSGA